MFLETFEAKKIIARNFLRTFTGMVTIGQIRVLGGDGVEGGAVLGSTGGVRRRRLHPAAAKHQRRFLSGADPAAGGRVD